jgi:hypothetical protein
MRTPKSVDKLANRRPAGKGQPGHDDARTIAIEGLEFLAADTERLERFLALSGLSPATLRAAAAAPGFLPAVLDHIAGEESLLLAFSAAAGRDPRDIARAREILGGRPSEPGA